MTRTRRERIAGLGDGRRRRSPGPAGRPGAGRSGPEADGRGRRRRSRAGRSPSESLGIAESTHAGRSSGRRIANEPSPPADPSATDVGHPSPCRTPSGAVRAASARPSRRHRHEPDATDGHRPDPDRTDHRPRAADVTSLTPGPSQAPTSPAAGRGRRTAVIGAVVVLALVVTFSAGIGVGRLSCRRWAVRRRRPRTLASLRADRLRAHPRGLGHDPPASTSAATSSTTRSSSTAPSTA